VLDQNHDGLYCALTKILRVYLPAALSSDEIDNSKVSPLSLTKTRDEKMTTTTGATKAIPELQADVLLYSEEIAKLEVKLLRQELSPSDRLETEIRLRRLERALLSATMNLSVATTKSEFSADVQRLDGKVATLSSRQDTVEQRQDDLESRFDEEKQSKNNELLDLKNKFDRLLEENKTRKAEEARLWSAVEEVRTEQRQTRRTVDVVDNRQRKQNLILHGLKPNTAKEELLSLLPADIGSLVDNVWPVTKVGTDGSVSMAVQFSKVSACEKAREIIASRDFKTRNGGRIRCAQDESELTRVGGSRLRAISEHLRAKFGEEIEVKRDYVRFGGVKYLAAEFARNIVVIGTTTVDVDAAVNSNAEARANPAVRTYVDGRDVFGVRLPRKRRADGDSTSPPPQPRHTRNNHAGAQNGGQGGHKGQRRQPYLTNNLPVLDDVTPGGVRLFNGGHGQHGDSRPRDYVMRVSSEEHSRVLGQPAMLFLQPGCLPS
jgi:hypothetical protein